jgi:hypothetical protein
MSSTICNTAGSQRVSREVEKGFIDSGYARLPVQGQNALLHARNDVLQHPGTSWGLHPMCFGIERLQIGLGRAKRRGLRHPARVSVVED